MISQTLSILLAVLGFVGIVALLTATGMVMWQYRNVRMQSFRWRLRNWRLKQLSAVACLFFLAMAASYAVLQEAWGWLYLIVAFKTGSWWLRYALGRGS